MRSWFHLERGDLGKRRLAGVESQKLARLQMKRRRNVQDIETPVPGLHRMLRRKLLGDAVNLGPILNGRDHEAARRDVCLQGFKRPKRLCL